MKLCFLCCLLHTKGVRNMAGEQLGWVFDSLVEFLRGPIWNIPILTFIEQKSVVFEPGAGNEDEFKKIHNAYKNLVDFMLGSYMEDLKITPEEFERACTVASKKALNQFHQSLFQQVWAADDFEIFRRMMTQKNLELQLQALEVLSQKYGIQPDCMEAMVDDRLTMDEANVMQEVMKKVLEEQVKEVETSENTETSAEEADLAMQEKTRLETEREKVKELMKEAMKQTVKESTTTSDSNDQEGAGTNSPVLEEAPPCSEPEENPVAEEAASESPQVAENGCETTENQLEQCIQSAAEVTLENDTMTVVSSRERAPIILPLLSIPVEPEPSATSLSMPQEVHRVDLDTTHCVTAQVEVTPMEMERRQQYLRQQRDRLLAMKRQERAKQLPDQEEATGRPRSARAARKILREESTEEVDPQTLAFRKSLAARLRTEVIDKAQ